ncbi:hypothetical protein COLO4_29344 [Corchorus olitorius]|uniref:Uncharacterized protein n=1 Tax=Corchorus olitorius TaxID=93759 RepID=A0A1R3HF84_9ROSI|nr:hypothetical protein COLO4_29344 [Corchorus olitorius]
MYPKEKLPMKQSNKPEIHQSTEPAPGGTGSLAPGRMGQW